jgi:hypothetical protein
MKLRLVVCEGYLLAISDDTPSKFYEGYYYLAGEIFNTKSHDAGI